MGRWGGRSRGTKKAGASPPLYAERLRLGEYGINKRRLGAEGGQIGIQRRGAAGVEEQHVGALGEVSLMGQIDEAGHGLAGVDGVEQDAFRAGEHLDGLDHGVGGQGVAGAHVVVEGYDFLGGPPERASCG